MPEAVCDSQKSGVERNVLGKSIQGSNHVQQ